MGRTSTSILEELIRDGDSPEQRAQFPKLLLVTRTKRRISKHGGRVQKRVDVYSSVGVVDLLRLALKQRDLPAGNEVLQGESPERHDEKRVDEPNLLSQPAGTSAYLMRAGVSIGGRTATNYVGDEDLVARHPAVLEHFIEQTAGSANERHAPSVLLRPRRFADDQQGSRIAAGARNDLRPVESQIATRAADHDGMQRRESPRAGDLGRMTGRIRGG